MADPRNRCHPARILLLDAFKKQDPENSGRISFEAALPVLGNAGLSPDDFSKLIDASSCRIDGSSDVNYIAFAQWLLESNAQEVFDAGDGELKANSKNWVDSCARLLETHSEADFIQKRIIAAQVRTQLSDLRDKQGHVRRLKDHARGKPRLAREKSQAGVTLGTPSLEWDGPALMERLLKEGPDDIPTGYVEKVLEAFLHAYHVRHPKPLVHVAVPQDGRVVVVGDTHGQLKDVLLIFLRFGLPSPKNVYVFNGDVADRGPNACEIFLLIFTLFLHTPDCIVLNRGNHEDEYMNFPTSNEGGGFYHECLDKHGESIFWKFVECYAILPLASIVHDQVFIVHGGIPGGRTPPSLARLNTIRHTGISCPPPHSENPDDKVFVDLLWSDPSERPGWTPNRRGAGVQWGPDVTQAFLKKNNLRWIIRSHELPYGDRGWTEHHLGLVFTLFSASFYWDSEVTWGAVALLTRDSSGMVQQSLREHSVESLAALAPVVAAAEGQAREDACLELGMSYTDAARVAVGKRRIELTLERLAGIVLEYKPLLWQQFLANDPTHVGVIPRGEWLECLKDVCGDYLPWEAAVENWLPDSEDGCVDYRKFLARFKVTLSQDKWCGWKSLVISDVYNELLQRNSTFSETLSIFDPSGDGIVSVEEFVDLLSDAMGGCLSKPQAAALSRTVFTHVDGAGLRVNDFLARFTVAFVHSKGMTDSEAPNPMSGLESTIEQIGKLMICSRRHDGGESRISSSFKMIDDSKDGFLQVDEFVKHVQALPGYHTVRHEGQPLSDKTLHEIAQALANSYSNDGAISLLEFAQAFAIVDSSGLTDLADDVQEHILVFLYRHRYALFSGCEEYDLDARGRIGKEDFRRVLDAVNMVAAKPEKHLVQQQTESLVESIADDDGTVEYKAFLGSFQIQTS